MIRAVEITLPEGAGEGAEALIAPRPFDHWGQRLRRFEAEGVRAVAEIGAENSECSAYLLTLGDGAPVRLRYELAICERPAPEWVWAPQVNRHTTAAPSLVALAQSLAEGAPDQTTALRRIVEEAASVFGYDHPEQRFNDGHDAVPMVCGTAKGSCVDINTYILAAARSVGIEGQYVAGYWFHPEKVETGDMHCWLAFRPDGRLAFWDLAHAMKWAATLGATVAEGLNPAGGRRVAMSCGRGLVFETGFGPVEMSHFSEPTAIGRKQGRAKKLPSARLSIRVEDPGGDRAQDPRARAEAAA